MNLPRRSRLSNWSFCSTSAIDSASSWSRVRLLLASRVGWNQADHARGPGRSRPCRPRRTPRSSRIVPAIRGGAAVDLLAQVRIALPDGECRTRLRLHGRNREQEGRAVRARRTRRRRHDDTEHRLPRRSVHADCERHARRDVHHRVRPPHRRLGPGNRVDDHGGWADPAAGDVHLPLLRHRQLQRGRGHRLVRRRRLRRHERGQPGLHAALRRRAADRHDRRPAARDAGADGRAQRSRLRRRHVHGPGIRRVARRGERHRPHTRVHDLRLQRRHARRHAGAGAAGRSGRRHLHLPLLHARKARPEREPDAHLHRRQHELRRRRRNGHPALRTARARAEREHDRLVRRRSVRRRERARRPHRRDCDLDRRRHRQLGAGDKHAGYVPLPPEPDGDAVAANGRCAPDGRVRRRQVELHDRWRVGRRGTANGPRRRRHLHRRQVLDCRRGARPAHDRRRRVRARRQRARDRGHRPRPHGRSDGLLGRPDGPLLHQGPVRRGVADDLVPSRQVGGRGRKPGDGRVEHLHALCCRRGAVGRHFRAREGLLHRHLRQPRAPARRRLRRRSGSHDRRQAFDRDRQERRHRQPPLRAHRVRGHQADQARRRRRRRRVLRPRDRQLARGHRVLGCRRDRDQLRLPEAVRRRSVGERFARAQHDVPGQDRAAVARGDPRRGDHFVPDAAHRAADGHVEPSALRQCGLAEALRQERRRNALEDRHR